jgi:hypothetical protein
VLPVEVAERPVETVGERDVILQKHSLVLHAGEDVVDRHRRGSLRRSAALTAAAGSSLTATSRASFTAGRGLGVGVAHPYLSSGLLVAVY